jgi:hypothetical protein
MTGPFKGGSVFPVVQDTARTAAAAVPCPGNIPDAARALTARP